MNIHQWDQWGNVWNVVIQPQRVGTLLRPRLLPDLPLPPLAMLLLLPLEVCIMHPVARHQHISDTA